MALPLRAAALAAVFAATPVLADDVTVTPVLSEQLPNVSGKAVTMVRVTFAPGASSPPHHHAGSVAVYVLKGSLQSQVDRGLLKTFKAGETFFEAPGAKHAVSANPSKTEPAEILAVFVADPGVTLTTNAK